MNLITIDPPAAEPVTLPEAKAQCRVTSAHEDAQFAIFIQAARERVEGFLRKRLITQTVEMRRTGLGGCIILPIAPIASVTGITYLDTANEEQTLDPALYRLAADKVPAQIVPAHLAVWPATLPDVDTVGITMTVGYGDAPANVPADIRVALLMLIEHYFYNRGAVTTGGAAAEIPEGVTQLLSRHILWI